MINPDLKKRVNIEITENNICTYFKIFINLEGIFRTINNK